MSRFFEFPETVEIEQQRMQVQHEDLERYRQLGILQTFTIQGDDDEDVEVQFKRELELEEKPGDVIYVAEPGNK